MMSDDMMSGAMGVGMVLWALLLLSLIALSVAATLRLLRKNRSTGPSARDNLDALDARYARGELEREDYLQRRADLTHER